MNLWRIDDASLVAAEVITLMLTLDQRRTFLLTGLLLVTLAVASSRSAAWSLTTAISSIRWSIREDEVEAVLLMSNYVDNLV